MRFDTLVWHYTATYEDQDIGAVEIDAMHKARGWSQIGYHKVIRLDGTVEDGRPLTVMGSHVGGQNSGKLGCVYVGGLRRATGPNVGFDTRTDAQKRAMVELTLAMLNQFPTIQRVVGHKDLAATQCPGFDVKAWWGSIKTGVPVRPVPPDATAPVVSYPVIRRGSRGKTVQVLQVELNNRGARLVADGVFGPATDRAVRDFQRSQRLEQDGIVGPATWAALFTKGA
jgi:N-acetylmuramoyl-L-alanine amidase